MMTNHSHVATPYELKSASEQRLNAIILPFLPEPKLLPKSKDSKIADWWEWETKPFNLIWSVNDKPGKRFYKKLQWQVGDRLYLQERWCKGDWGTAFDDNIYFLESSTPEAENIGWQPAHTMPLEAAQHWFAIIGVRVVQAKTLQPKDMIEAGLFPKNFQDLDCFETVKVWKNQVKALNQAYPDQLWDGDLWVVVLQVEPISP